MKFIAIMILFFATLLPAPSWSADYKFNSKVNFVFDSSFVPGVLDQYAVDQDPSVNLMVGNLSEKKLKKEIDLMSDNQLIEKFLAKARDFDVFEETKREIAEQSVVREKDEIRIFIKYKLVQKSGTNFEIDYFVVRENNSIASTLNFSGKTSPALQNELIIGQKSLSLVQTTANNEEIHPAKKYSFLKFLNFAAGTPAFAGDSCEGVNKKYVVRGNYTTKPGSALFNFEKLSDDLKLSLSTGNEQQIRCMTNTMNRAVTNASDYWAKRGVNEGCLAEDGSVPSSKPAACPAATFREMNRSFAYLDEVKTDMTKTLDNPAALAAASPDDCPARPAANNLRTLASTGDNFKQNFCCDPGNAKGESKGPLHLVLESEESYRNSTPEQQHAACVRKTIGQPNRSVASLGGAADCVKNIVTSLVKALVDMLKSIVSLFDWETIKFLGKLINITNRQEQGEAWAKVGSAVKAMAEKMGAELYSVTSCLGPYDRDQYVCKMVGSVASLFVGPGLIKPFLKWIQLGAKASGLTTLMTSAASKPPLKNALAISRSARTAVSGRASALSSATRARALAVTTRMASTAKGLLSRDFKTPMRNLVAASAQKIVAANRAAASTARAAAAEVRAQAARATAAVRETIESRTSAVTRNAEEAVVPAPAAPVAPVAPAAIPAAAAAPVALSATEGSALVSRATFGGANRTAFVADAKAAGILPTEVVSVGTTKISVGAPFDIGGGRVAAIAVVDTGTEVTTQMLYRSNSQGVFRLLPGRTQGGWFSKGVGEASLDAPSEVQRLLAQRMAAGEIRTGVPIRVFEESVPTYATPYEAMAAAGRNPALNIERQAILEEPATTIRSGATTHTPPAELKVKTPGQNPEFTAPVATYETATSTAGTVKATVFRSADGTLEYTFFEDQSGRAWIASVGQRSAGVNSAGIRSVSVEAGDLTMPRFEYHQQIPSGYHGTGKPVGGLTEYGDAWPYLRETPIIKNYYRSRGLPVPP